MVLNSITDRFLSYKDVGHWRVSHLLYMLRGGVPGEIGEPSGGAAGFQRLCYTLMTTVCSNNEARLAHSFRRTQTWVRFYFHKQKASPLTSSRNLNFCFAVVSSPLSTPHHFRNKDSLSLLMVTLNY